MLKLLVHQARVAVGNLFGLQADPSAPEYQNTFELGTTLSSEVGSSLPMYYAFYYRPLFRIFRRRRPASQAFPSTKIDEWLHQIRLTSGDLCKFSPEAHAFFDLARDRDELVWTIATLVAGLNACLTSEEAISVLSTALSLCFDPKCILPIKGILNIPFHVALLFHDGSQRALREPRYGLNCTLGKRLREDVRLMSHLGKMCGLQEEISSKVKVKVKMGYEASTEQRRVELTLALVALIPQL